MYDNKKLKAAVKGWLKARCNVGFGQEYSGSLLDDFCQYCAEMGALQASPGIVAFGKELNRLGFGRKRVTGLQYVTGLSLKIPVPPPDRRQARTVQHGEELEAERKKRAANKKRKAKRELSKTTDSDGIAARMQQETKERNIQAGESE